MGSERTGEKHGPTVSVCIPALNAERFIGPAIDSVLNQTYTDWELIVLDNNSSDGTAALARSYSDRRIRVHQQSQTVPITRNWNDVAAQATGRYLKLLCADDLLHPDCLAAEVSVLDRNPDVSLVASRRDFIDAGGEVVLRGQGLKAMVGLHRSADVVRRVVRSGMNPIGWPTALMFRNRDFKSAGGFRGEWIYPMDLELAIRLLRYGLFFGMETAHAAFRISDGSISSTLRGQSRQHRQVLKSVAAEPHWNIDRSTLAIGLVRTRLQAVKNALLFRAVRSSWKPLRMLPGLVLPQPAAAAGQPSGGPLIETSVTAHRSDPGY